jgi:hypothetical protein
VSQYDTFVSWEFAECFGKYHVIPVILNEEKKHISHTHIITNVESIHYFISASLALEKRQDREKKVCKKKKKKKKNDGCAVSHVPSIDKRLTISFSTEERR